MEKERREILQREFDRKNNREIEELKAKLAEKYREIEEVMFKYFQDSVNPEHIKECANIIHQELNGGNYGHE